MTSKENFIAEIEKLLTTGSINEDAMTYFNNLKSSSVITKKGAAVLEEIQKQTKDYVFTSKMIAEVLNVSSRSVSGTLKKLVSDGFIEKVNTTSPISYKATEMGYTFTI